MAYFFIKFLAAPAEPKCEKTMSLWQLRPSSIARGRGWWKTIATLPHLFPAAIHRYEYRYPYLDRDLVEFLLRIPAPEFAQVLQQVVACHRASRHHSSFKPGSKRLGGNLRPIRPAIDSWFVS